MDLFEQFCDNLMESIKEVIKFSCLTISEKNVISIYFKDDQINNIKDFNDYICNAFSKFSQRKHVPISKPSNISVNPLFENIDNYKNNIEKEFSIISIGNNIEKQVLSTIKEVERIFNQKYNRNEKLEEIKTKFNDLGLLFYYLMEKGYSFEITSDRFGLGDILIVNRYSGNKIIAEIKSTNSFEGEFFNKRIFGSMLQVTCYYVNNILKQKENKILNIGVIFMFENPKLLRFTRIIVFRIGYLLIEYLKKYCEIIDKEF